MNDAKLETLDEQGTAPRSVIADGTSAHAIKQQLITADIPRSRQRATIKAMYDGHPPFDPADLKKRGQGDRSNTNMKRAAAMTNQMSDSYLDMQFETSTMADVQIEHGTSGKGYDFSEIVTREFNRTLRRWIGFYDVMSLSNFNRCYYGTGPIYFQNGLTWRPVAAEAGQIMVDKDASTDISRLDIMCIKRYWRMHELYRSIENETIAGNLGWNVKATEEAIRRSKYQGETFKSAPTWEQLNKEIKNNDLWYSYVSPPVILYDMLAKEYDGTISRRILTEWDSDNVLYQKMDVANQFNQLIFPFFLSKQEGSWHSIRGLGAQFYNVLRALDLVDNQILDMTMIGGSLVIRPKTGAAYDKLNSVRLGPVTVIPPDVDYIQATFPNLSTTGIPTHNLLLQTLSNTTGSYHTNSSMTQDGGEAATATEKNIDLSQLSSLSSSQQNQFYNECDNLLLEMFRRMANPNLPDRNSALGKQEDFKEARDFQQRCLDRGVPLSALQAPYLQTVKSTRSIGNGSRAMKEQKANELMQMLGLISDQDVRQKMLKDIYSAKFTNSVAQRYFPPQPSIQLRSDAKTAELENAGFKSGNSFDVMDHENPVIHLQIHIPPLMQAAQAATAQGGNGQPNPQNAQQVFSLLAIALPHCSDHLKRIASDPTQKQEVVSVGKILNQLNNVAVKLQQQIGAAATQAQKQALQQAQQQNVDSQKLQLEAGKLALAQRKQAHKEATDNVKLQLQVAKDRQSLSLNDLSASIDLHQAAQPAMTNGATAE